MKCKKISALIKIYTVIVLFALILAASGCKFFTGAATGTAAPHLTVKGAPSNISSIILTISGPGMNTIKSSYGTDTTSISVSVPAGEDRHFELMAYVDPSSPSAATSFKGTATADLKAGEKKTISLDMIVNKTKLVIPDYQNIRIVQIDDMEGSGWIENNGTDIGFVGNFYPYDVDFDASGRIYIANNGASTGEDVVIRIDNMNATSNDVIVSGTGSGIVAISIDRNNNLIYFATSSQLYRCNDDGGNLKNDFGMGSIFNIRGLAVDENGLVYIAWSNTDTCAITVYNPNVSNGIILDTKYYGGALYEEGWDVMVKSSYIYAAVFKGSSGQDKIIKFSFNIQTNSLVEHDLYITNLFGPRRFIGINRNICFIDESTVDRLVAMDNINGDNIEYYGVTGTGVGQFRFLEP